MKLSDAQKAIEAHERIVSANQVLARLPSSEVLFNYVAAWFSAKGIGVYGPQSHDRISEFCGEIYNYAVSMVQKTIDDLRAEVAAFDADLSKELGKPAEIEQPREV